MVLKLYNSDVVGNRANCLYPHEIEISNATELASAVAKDHVAAKYKDSYRSVDNFVSSTVLPMDIDNTHSDNPDDWITDEKLSDMMPTVQYALVPSRNHMKEKDGKAARPKYHAFFSIDECADSDVYADMKVQLQQIYPFFDENALDAARFMFASNVSADDIIWHDGFETIEEAEGLSRNVKKQNTPKPAGQTSYEKVIPMGQRNNTLSRFAGIILKKYGNTDRTKQIFVQRAADCEEPLSEHELTNIWMSAVGFYNDTILQDPSYVAPDEYNQDFGNFSMKPSDYSDIGQAELFSNMYKDSVKYTDSTDYIRFRESGCWVESRMAGISAVVEFLNLQLMDAEETLKICTENLIATGVSEGAVKAGGKALLKEVSTADQLKALDMYDKAIKYFAFVMKHRDYKYIQSAANTAKHMLEISINDLDADGYLLNTPGMTFDLRKDIAECHEPDPRDLITKQTLVCPGDEGEDLWLDAIDTFFCKDKELIEYVQRIVGMAAIGEVRMEALIIAYGEGRNGKSTFWNTISNILGTYSGTISAEALTFGCRHNARPEMAELKGKRLVIAAELEDGTRLNTAVVKKLCSTDEIAAEKKYKDPFKYKPSHTLVLYTNHLPRVGVSDEGTWRRLIVIPFNAKIEGNSDIKNYTAYLTENAGPYIMKWIIEGAYKAMEDDFHFTKPKVVQDAIDTYRQNNDWLGLFMDECCEVGDTLKQPSGAFYQEYREWCSRNGEFTRSTTDFYSAIDQAGFERKKTKKGAFIFGVRIKEVGFMD